MNTSQTSRLALVAMLLALSCAVPGRAQKSDAGTTQAVTAVYAQRDAALGRKDIVGATACFAPDFHFIDEKGHSEDAQQYRKRVGGNLRDVKTGQSQTTIQAIALTPTGAVVTARRFSQFVADYRVLFVKKTVHVTIDGSVRDTWVKTGPIWQLKQSQLLSQKQDVHL